MSRLVRPLMLALFFMFGHTFIFGGLVFLHPVIMEGDVTYDVETFMEDNEETTYAYAFDDRGLALDLRLALIEEAEETVDVSYYTVHDGESRDIFYGALLDAADRGVQVRLVLDAVFHTQYFESGRRYEALISHENVEAALYEPYNPLLPHTLQNRLHDKLIIVDETYGMSGGRNIGDRYFMEKDDPADETRDRDVVVFGESGTHETVREMSAYYEELFNSRFSWTSSAEERLALLERRTLMQDAYEAHSERRDVPRAYETMREEALEVEHTSFLRNPLTRFEKEPVMLGTFAELAETRDEWFVQSPYIVFSEQMLELIPDTEQRDVRMLTNAPATNPNPFTTAGYLRYREPLAERTTLYEYQGVDSLHAKTMTFGDDISIIGAYNLDPRSTYLSTESAILIRDEAFHEHLHDILKDSLDESLIVGPDGEYVDDGGEALEKSWPWRVLLIMLYGLTYWFDPLL